MIQFVRYSDDPAINAAAQRHVNNMAPNPFDHRGTHDDKTVGAIVESLRRGFGDFAHSVRITVH